MVDEVDGIGATNSVTTNSTIRSSPMLKALISQSSAQKNEKKDVEQDQDDELRESLRRYNALVKYHIDEDERGGLGDPETKKKKGA